MKYIQETVVGQNGKNICPGAVSLLRHWSVRLIKHKCIDNACRNQNHAAGSRICCENMLDYKVA